MTSLSTAPRTPLGGGIDPSIWGKSAWTFIRCILQTFDPATQDSEALCRWINALPQVLPCYKCRINFTHTLQKYPFKEYCDKGLYTKWYDSVREEVRRHETPSNVINATTTTTNKNGTQNSSRRRRWGGDTLKIGVGALLLGFGVGVLAYRHHLKSKAMTTSSSRRNGGEFAI